jgi:hypothetical protein
MIGDARQRGRQMVEAVQWQAHRARRAVGHHEADVEAVGPGIDVERRHVVGNAVCFRHLVTIARDDVKRGTTSS